MIVHNYKLIELCCFPLAVHGNGHHFNNAIVHDDEMWSPLSRLYGMISEITSKKDAYSS